MALAFNIKPVATIRARQTDASYINIAGCTNSNTITPAQAAAPTYFDLTS